MRRTSWFFAVVMMAGCLFAIGQNGPGGGYQHNGNMANAHLNWLSQQLDLTEDQMAKLRPILMEEGQQMKAAREDTSLSPDQKQSKLKEIHKTFEPRINAVLTPEQQDKYKQLEQEAREKHEKKLKDKSESVPKQWVRHAKRFRVRAVCFPADKANWRCHSSKLRALAKSTIWRQGRFGVFQ